MRILATAIFATAPERDVLDLWKAPSDLGLRLSRAISVATVNYRCVPNKVRMSEPLYDAARSIQFLRLHAKEYNVNPNGVIPSGCSESGVMGLWIAFDDLADLNIDDSVKRQSTRVHNLPLGVFLNEKMHKLGIECIFWTPKDYPGQKNRPFTSDMVDFFETHCGK